MERIFSSLGHLKPLRNVRISWRNGPPAPPKTRLRVPKEIERAQRAARRMRYIARGEPRTLIQLTQGTTPSLEVPGKVRTYPPRVGASQDPGGKTEHLCPSNAINFDNYRDVKLAGGRDF